MKESLNKAIRLLERNKSLELKLVRNEPASRIAVVSGRHDKIEELLDAAHIPYENHTLRDLLYCDQAYILPEVIFINSQKYPKDNERTAMLRDYVAQGGRLVTTDWALTAVLDAFPEYVKTSIQLSRIKFPITSANDIGARLLGKNIINETPNWWFETARYAICANPDKPVIPLLVTKSSNELVAFGLKYGKGEIIHFCNTFSFPNNVYASVLDYYSEVHAVLFLSANFKMLEQHIYKKNRQVCLLAGNEDDSSKL